MLKSLTLILSPLIVGSVVFAATPKESPVSPSTPVGEVQAVVQLVGFKDWKQTQVFNARAALDQFKAQNTVKSDPQPVAKASVDDINKESSSEKPEEPQVKQPEKALSQAEGERLRQLEFNLEIALGLTIHDYFAIYLKSKSKEEMVQAVQKLSPEELSELMMAYRHSIYGVPKAASSKAKAPAPQKL